MTQEQADRAQRMCLCTNCRASYARYLCRWRLDASSGMHRRNCLYVQIQLVSKTGKTYQGDRFFENLGGLAMDYGGDVGNINILQHFLTVHEGGIVYTFVPPLLRPVVQYVAIPLARLVGYKGYYPEYRTSFQ